MFFNWQGLVQFYGRFRLACVGLPRLSLNRTGEGF